MSRVDSILVRVSITLRLLHCPKNGINSTNYSISISQLLLSLSIHTAYGFDIRSLSWSLPLFSRVRVIVRWSCWNPAHSGVGTQSGRSISCSIRIQSFWWVSSVLSGLVPWSTRNNVTMTMTLLRLYSIILHNWLLTSIEECNFIVSLFNNRSAQ